jgi:hypothetical protein
MAKSVIGDYETGESKVNSSKAILSRKFLADNPGT